MAETMLAAVWHAPKDIRVDIFRGFDGVTKPVSRVLSCVTIYLDSASPHCSSHLSEAPDQR